MKTAAISKSDLAAYLHQRGVVSIARYIEILEEGMTEDMLRKNTELAALQKRLEKAEGFIKEIFELSDWPDGGDIDGFELQEAMVHYGLLIPENRTKPCGEFCSCVQYYDKDEWEDGVTCYVKADWLIYKKGE